MSDLSNYLSQIHEADDRPLFMEAERSANAGALRAAYVMLWLSCAESLKRRFREAKQRDAAAAKIDGEVTRKEEEHRSVDKFVLEKAREYGLLSETAYKVLLHVYEMRCVYGHPYEEAPSEEQVNHAASVVVEHVLSQPLRLRHGFCQLLLGNMLQEEHFLDDVRTAVEQFAEDTLPRIDIKVIPWLLNEYWTALEAIADDPSMKLFFDRGLWFCRAILSTTGLAIFDQDEWHTKAGDYPKTLIRTLTRKELFEPIGERAQDSLVGSAVKQAFNRPSTLRVLERIEQDDGLTTRQKERFHNCVSLMTVKHLRSSGLSATMCFNRIIDQLKAYDWYKQSPAIDLAFSRGPDWLQDLSEDQLTELGRNVLQAAQGNERSAATLLASKRLSGWPSRLISGALLECFTNDDDQLRFKCRRLPAVLGTIEKLTPEKRDSIVSEAVSSVLGSTPKNSSLSEEEFEEALDIVDKYDFAKHLGDALEEKRDALPTEGEVKDE